MTMPTEDKLLPYTIARAFKPKEAFGEPRAFLNTMDKDENGVPRDGQSRTMGVIFGTAEAVHVSKRANSRQDGYDYSFGLAGAFEYIPADRKRAPGRTGTAWLPTHIHDVIAAMLKENVNEKTGEIEENPEGVEAVDFAFQVNVKSNNKSSTGFTWDYVTLHEVKQGGDRLHHLRSALPATLLPAPTAVSVETGGDVPESEDRGDEAGEGEAEAKSGNAAIGAAGAVAKGRGRG